VAQRTISLVWWGGAAAGIGVLLAAGGCFNSPINLSQFTTGPAPLREPSPGQAAESGHGYEDSLRGGKIFSMYCAYCHNARSLAERPFSNYKNVAAHMRVRANLTGKEYAELLAFMRRFHDVPAPEQRAVPSPKLFIPSQPITELQKGQPRTAPDLVSGPRGGVLDEASPGQPQPGMAPREAR
jgi:hypothetical protein